MANKNVDMETISDDQRRLLEASGFRPVLQWQKDGVTVSTKTALDAAGAFIRVDLPALRAALSTLAAHEQLIDESELDLWDIGGSPGGLGLNPITRVSRAIRHIVDDEFRGRETRGGS